MAEVQMMMHRKTPSREEKFLFLYDLIGVLDSMDRKELPEFVKARLERLNER